MTDSSSKLPKDSDTSPALASESSKPRARIKHELSETFIASLKAPHPSGKTKLYWDSVTPYFGVSVSGRSNARWYVVQRGAVPRKAIDRVELLSLETARATAVVWAEWMKDGTDPKQRIEAEQAERVRAEVEAEAKRVAERAAAEAASITLRAAFEKYIAMREGVKLGKTAAAWYRTMLRLHLSDWADLPVTSITSEMVPQRFHQIIAKVRGRRDYRGEATANSAIRALGAAVRNLRRFRKDLVLVDVREAMEGLWARERRRTRRLPYSKLPAFCEAVATHPNELCRVAIVLFLLSGARREEILALRWDEVDLDQGVIVLAPERNKSGNRFTLPLSDLMVSALRMLRAKGCDSSGYIFPGRMPGRHLWRLPLDAIGDTLGERISCHDFRRLHETVAENKAELSDMGKRRLLNHSSRRDTASGYNQPDLDDIRRLQQRVTDAFETLCGPALRQVCGMPAKRPASSVHGIKRRRTGGT